MIYTKPEILTDSVASSVILGSSQKGPNSFDNESDATSAAYEADE
jgi:hypothetical protein